jgi:hypothetical protein
VQHDPEPEPVHRDPEPARRRGDVAVEEEDLAGLPGLSGGWLAGDEGTGIVLAEDAGGEKSQKQPDLGRECRGSEEPRHIVRARRRAPEQWLQKRAESIDIEVDPLGPARDSHGTFGGRQGVCP